MTRAVWQLEKHVQQAILYKLASSVCFIFGVITLDTDAGFALHSLLILTETLGLLNIDLFPTPSASAPLPADCVLLE